MRGVLFMGSVFFVSRLGGSIMAQKEQNISRGGAVKAERAREEKTIQWGERGPAGLVGLRSERGEQRERKYHGRCGEFSYMFYVLLLIGSGVSDKQR